MGPVGVGAEKGAFRTRASVLPCMFDGREYPADRNSTPSIGGGRASSYAIIMTAAGAAHTLFKRRFKVTSRA